MSEEKTELAFDTLVKPTREQAKDLWNSIKEPSIRKAAALAKKRGWEISAKTFARWKAQGWVEPPKVKNTRAQNKLTRATRELRKAATDVSSIDALRANPAIQESLQALKDCDYKGRTLTELLKLDKAALKLEAEKILLATTIIVGEAVCEKASVVSLTPREVGAFVESGQNAAKAIASGEEVAGEATKPADVAAAEPVAPPNPVSDAVVAFKRKMGAA